MKLYFCFSYDPEQFAGAHTPILVIGTKLDQAQAVREIVLKRSSNIAEECGADEINLVRLENKLFYRNLLLQYSIVYIYFFLQKKKKKS